MSDVEKIINALKDEYSYNQDIGYESLKEGDEDRATWYYGKAAGVKKCIETIEKMKNYGIIL